VVACLDCVRQSAAVVLILGERYGTKQPSGLSATHEEFREARERGPVLVFVQAGISPDADQAAFIKEVEEWRSGYMRDGFSTPGELRSRVTRAIYKMSLAAATAPFNSEEVLARALSVFPRNENYSHRGEALTVAVFGGPSQTILRPSETENLDLAVKLEQQALYGSTKIFARGEGTTSGIENDNLVIKQDGRESRFIRLDGQGGIVIHLPLAKDPSSTFSVIVVETVHEHLQKALQYAIWLLDEIDSTQKLSHLVVAASVVGGLGMLTREELNARPNSLSMPGFGRTNTGPVHLTPPHVTRPALSQDMVRTVSDLVTLLRRQRHQQ
jgi:hypothetical protein